MRSGCDFLQDIDWKNLDKQVNRALPSLKRQWDNLAKRVRKDPEWRRFQWLSVKTSKKSGCRYFFTIPFWMVIVNVC